MPTTLVCDHHGQRFVADISVSGLDAFTYRAETGEDLDARIGVLVASAPEEDTGWLLADRAVIIWIWHRQNIDPTVSFASVAALVKLMPDEEPATPVAGSVAPEAD